VDAWILILIVSLVAYVVVGVEKWIRSLTGTTARLHTGDTA
jgi:hypothetical protein